MLRSHWHRHVISLIAAMTCGTLAVRARPFPHGDAVASYMALRAATTYQAIVYTDRSLYFVTPYLLTLWTLSTLYVFATRGRRLAVGPLPPYPAAHVRENLFVVLGEVQHARRLGPSAEPHWLTVPERGLYTGICVVGAVG